MSFASRLKVSLPLVIQLVERLRQSNASNAQQAVTLADQSAALITLSEQLRADLTVSDAKLMEALGNDAIDAEAIEAQRQEIAAGQARIGELTSINTDAVAAVDAAKAEAVESATKLFEAEAAYAAETLDLSGLADQLDRVIEQPAVEA